ncbi:cupin-like domain-containing protein [Pseudoalteromonas luteoviolacea]|uniref:cupin-like domain-containing protein n=1 Tax=Pseudoalteromonas luteoviolacea TaxID=43657 RepID=UPI001F3991E6|nr:cupin-like domain-containing protein [Pseudoalteromonas luteoviolacea]MCF6437902.1 cupin-like domain-containing protein [Pseudoalteromonas luteoviolacea]
MSENIPRVKSLTKEVFQRDFLSQNKPVIIEGFADSWRAVSSWGPQFWSDNYGDKEMLCLASKSHQYPDFSELSMGEIPIPEPTSFKSYIDRVTTLSQDEPSFLSLNRIIFSHGPRRPYNKHIDLAQYQNDFETPDLIDKARLELGLMWMQAKGTQSWMHQDQFENLYVQVQGQKRIIMAAPEDASNVYYNMHHPYYCEVDIFDIDYARFPLLKNAKLYEIVLNPGDMLFIPVFWFHAVESLGDFNLSLNWWFEPERVLLSQPSMHYFMEKVIKNVMADNKKDSKELYKLSLLIQDKILEQTPCLLSSFYNS